MTNEARGRPCSDPRQAQRWCLPHLSSGSLSWLELSLEPQQLESVPPGSGSPFSMGSRCLGAGLTWVVSFLGRSKRHNG